MDVYLIRDTDWVIAESEQDAWKVWREYLDSAGLDVPDKIDPREIELWLPARMLRISDDNEDYAATKSCKEWAEEVGRGFLCSTEY
jgi:hypothetical protein